MFRDCVLNNFYFLNWSIISLSLIYIFTTSFHGQAFQCSFCRMGREVQDFWTWRYGYCASKEKTQWSEVMDTGDLWRDFAVPLSCETARSLPLVGFAGLLVFLSRAYLSSHHGKYLFSTKINIDNWPLNNMCLTWTGPLIRGFLDKYTIVL